MRWLVFAIAGVAGCGSSGKGTVTTSSPTPTAKASAEQRANTTDVLTQTTCPGAAIKMENGVEKGHKKLGLGYDYPLSKRTNVYADLGRGTVSGLTSNTAYAFGVKHTF